MCSSPAILAKQPKPKNLCGEAHELTAGRRSFRWTGMRSEACEHGACYDCTLIGCDHECHREVLA